MRPLPVLFLAPLFAPALAGVPFAQVAELQKLSASFASSTDAFGWDVSVSGDRVLVGSPSDGPVAANSGAAYVFERAASGAWVEVARLFPADAAQADAFGRSVAIDGDRALVGAYTDDGPAGTDQGAAYVFERQADGSWLETAKLTPTVPIAFDQFGDEVALAGNFAAVGTYRNDDAGTNAGKAWVFELQGGGWVEVAALTASDGTAADEFGRTLALSGTTLLVGAPEQAVTSGNSHGAAYVFERVGGPWVETQKLASTELDSLDHFGWSVALDGDRAVVSASMAESPGEPWNRDEGALYVFERSGGPWVQVARLEASDADADDELGHDVALSGDRITAGSRNEDEGGNNAGAAYVFQLVGGTWVQTKILSGDTTAGDLLGCSVAASGDLAVVGAFGDDDFGSNSGSAYVFDAEPLSSGGGTLSLSSGGTWPFDLDAGHLHAGRFHFLLGSASGTAPGLPLGPGLVLPLQVDFYFDITLNNPNQPPLVNSLGVLDATGHADAAFTLAPGTNPALAGATAYHAFAAIAPGPTVTFVSNAVGVGLVP